MSQPALRDSKNGYPYQGRPGWPQKHRWVPDNPELLDWADNQVLATKDDGYNYAAGDNAYYTSGLSVSGSTTTLNQIEIAPGAGIYVYAGMSSFCATCHKQYLTKSGSAGHPSTDAEYYYYPGTQDAQDGEGDIARYRHAVARRYTTPKPLRFASVSVDGADPVTSPDYTGFQCLSCHFAHGTNAEASGFAQGIPPTNDSALLYLDNRGVCATCHQQDKFAPTPTPGP